MITEVAFRAVRPSGRRSRLMLSAALILGLGMPLAGCKTGAERAEEYFQSGLGLLAEGDPDRAILQFRNVFNEDGTHYEARKTLADLYRDQGRIREAYGQYLRLAEQYPDDLPTRIGLARMAVDTFQQDEFERHALRAHELAPDDPDVQALDLARRYHAVVAADDTASQTEIARAASDLIKSRPDDVLLLSILLDQAARTRNLDEAGRMIERLIALQPDNRIRYQQRLAWLVERNDLEGIEAHLRMTIDRFPDEVEARADLVKFLVSQNRPADAESYLRELAEAAPVDDPTPRADLISFVQMTRGEDAARAETEAALAAGSDPMIFEALLAGFDFRAGRPDEATARMRRVLETVETSSPRSRDMQVQLARVLTFQGHQDEARALVADVLAADPAHLGGRKMQASWDIEGDRIGEAISELRSVLDQAPEDAEAMSLMADAYYRAGEPDLMRDYLAQAAAASGNAPAETLRFAQSLLDEGRLRPAEDALLPALRRAPGNVDLLALLGQVYVAMPDRPRAGHVISTLQELDTPVSRNIARQLELAQASQQGGQQGAVEYLQQLADQGDAALEAQLGLLRAHVSAGDIEAAERLLAELDAAHPGDRLIGQAKVVVAAASGDQQTARDEVERLIAEEPTDPAPHMMRLRLVSQMEGQAAALDIIEASLQQVPDHPDLLWAKAGLLERQGDVDGAIAIFDSLYQQNSSATIIANNLASLLATHYADDPEKLARATTVAQRLRGTEVAPFMDTYGWIQHLNGDSAAALPYLQGAAEGLPEDATVQLHLGIVQAALGQTEEAEAQLQHGLEMAGEQTNHSIALARQVLNDLQNPAVPASEDSAANLN